MAGDKKINLDVAKAIKKLEEIPGLLTVRKRRAILRKGAAPVLEAAKNNIYDSDEDHHRYKTAKASGKIKAPKGKGVKLATYKSGNLRRSIKILTFRKAKTSVFVGPKVEKRGASGLYSSDDKVDGYYAAMVEFGTVNMKWNPSKGFMRKAAASEAKKAKDIITAEVAKMIKRWAAKNKV